MKQPLKRVIVDYAKLTNEILSLLVEKFPEGYDENDIVRFKNAKNETVEAVEVKTDDTIYLVKVSTKLADRIENYEDDEIDGGEAGDDLDALSDLEVDDTTDDDDEVVNKSDIEDEDDEDEDSDEDIDSTDMDDEDEEEED